MSFRKIITSAVGVPESATDDEIAYALAEIIHPQVPGSTTGAANLRDDPQAEFEKLAELYAKTHSVSLAEGYRQVSIQAPTLYDRATDKARLS
jgi:hypothetical protein